MGDAIRQEQQQQSHSFSQLHRFETAGTPTGSQGRSQSPPSLHPSSPAASQATTSLLTSQDSLDTTGMPLDAKTVELTNDEGLEPSFSETQQHTDPETAPTVAAQTREPLAEATVIEETLTEEYSDSWSVYTADSEQSDEGSQPPRLSDTLVEQVSTLSKLGIRSSVGNLVGGAPGSMQTEQTSQRYTGPGSILQRTEVIPEDLMFLSRRPVGVKVVNLFDGLVGAAIDAYFVIVLKYLTEESAERLRHQYEVNRTSISKGRINLDKHDMDKEQSMDMEAQTNSFTIAGTVTTSDDGPLEYTYVTIRPSLTNLNKLFALVAERMKFPRVQAARRVRPVDHVLAQRLSKEGSGASAAHVVAFCRQLERFFMDFLSNEALSITELKVRVMKHTIREIPFSKEKRQFSRNFPVEKTICEGVVRRAQWRLFWRDEWATLFEDRLVLWHPSISRGPTVEIALKDILSVDAHQQRSEDTEEGRDKDDRSHYLTAIGNVLCISTCEQIHYLQVEGIEELSQWISALHKAIAVVQSALRSDNANVAPWWEPLVRSFDENRHTKRMDGGRIVLNRYNLSLRPSSTPPGDLARELLVQMSTIYDYFMVYDAHHPYREPPLSPKFLEAAYQDLLQLFRATAQLQAVDLSGLSQLQLLAFWLNIYHILAMHTCLVLGTPSSLTERKQFFFDAAYEVGGVLLTLSELEHCILRAPMSMPRTNFLVKSFLPRFRSSDPRKSLALAESDPRVSFVLNNGSQSSPSFIMAFHEDVLDQQLHLATEMYIGHEVRISSDGRSLVLPRVLDYYWQDFGGTGEQVVTFLLENMNKQQLMHTMHSLSRMSSSSSMAASPNWTGNDAPTSPQWSLNEPSVSSKDDNSDSNSPLPVFMSIKEISERIKFAAYNWSFAGHFDISDYRMKRSYDDKDSGVTFIPFTPIATPERTPT
eukprot:Clim_evm3s84 gene=Clim_evmTU3s84